MNLDCNLQTVEAKPAIDGGNAKQTKRLLIHILLTLFA